MKHAFFVLKLPLCISVGITALNIFAAEPVMDFNYSGGAVVNGGKCKAPVIEGETLMPDGMPTALRLDGKKNYITLPDGENFTFKHGGALYAVVKYDPKKEYGMLFFKEREFLFGSYKGALYFNMPNGKPYNANVFSGPVPYGRWVSLAASVSVAGKDYHVTLYINGNASKTVVRKNVGYRTSSGKLTIGKGWGGVWFFSGEIAVLKAYDKPLSAENIAALDKASPYAIRR